MRIKTSEAAAFESFVNSEEYQTTFSHQLHCFVFESFVNSEEYQTDTNTFKHDDMFESFVNSEEYQTLARFAPCS